jgi:hypothetical protein
MGLKKKKWFQTLMAIAPKVAAGLGGPIAGLAMNTLKNALGMPDATEAEIEKKIAEGSPETFLALKKAGHDFEIAMRDFDITEDQLVYEDIQSARGMHVSQMEHTPSILSYLSMVIFFGVVILVVTQGQFFEDNTMAQNVAYMVIGASIGWVEKAYSFWLGSSRGSKAKSDTMAKFLEVIETKV